MYFSLILYMNKCVCNVKNDKVCALHLCNINKFVLNGHALLICNLIIIFSLLILRLLHIQVKVKLPLHIQQKNGPQLFYYDLTTILQYFGFFLSDVSVYRGSQSKNPALFCQTLVAQTDKFLTDLPHFTGFIGIAGFL